MITTTLTVIRHGETEWNVKELYQGHLDSSLTPLGIKQAEAVAGVIGAFGPFDAFYSSDLDRAYQTAEIINERLYMSVITDPRLRERNLGIMQGLTRTEMKRKHPEEYKKFNSHDPDYIIPDGESLRQKHDRVLAWAEDILALHTGESVLAVTHGGVEDSLYRYTMDYPLDKPRQHSLYNAAVNVITVTGNEWNLETWGYADHLDELGKRDDW